MRQAAAADGRRLRPGDFALIWAVDEHFAAACPLTLT